MNRDSYFDNLQVVKIPNPDPTSIRLTRLPDTYQEAILTYYEKGQVIFKKIVQVAKTNIKHSE